MSVSSMSGPLVSTGGFQTGTEAVPVNGIDSSGNLYQQGVIVSATAAQMNLLASKMSSAARRLKVTFAQALTAGIASARCFGILLPELGNVLITAAYLYVETGSTGGTATIDMGVAASNVDATQLFAAQAVGSTGYFTSTGVPLQWATTQYLTCFATVTAATTGMVAYAYIDYTIL